MKKILSLVLIMMTLSFQTCFAEDEPEEDINSLFSQIEAVEPETEQKKPEIANDNNNTVQINGFVEYDEQEERPEEPQDELEENAVLLTQPDMVKNINFSAPKKMNSNSLLGAKKPTFQPLSRGLETAASKFSTQEYAINPVSTSYSHKVGKFSFGTMYDSTLDSASAYYSTGVFSKYEGNRFALSTSFARSTNLNDDGFSSKIYISPELKITKRLSLLNVMQTDVNQINKKTELVLRYKPHFKKYADDVQFELGAGQSFYQDNYVKSSVRFSTKFKL